MRCARETDGFLAASIDLFGSVSGALYGAATKILESVALKDCLPGDADAQDIATAPRAQITKYKEEVPDLWSSVRVVDDLNSMMMVNHGHLLISADAEIPCARIDPLVAHEVGIHVLTRYNGYRQPLSLFEVGTAHYDALQEGLGTFAEYLSGYLPPSRLRIIAARVIACDMAIERKTVEEVFETLYEEHDLFAHDAFDTAVRAKRGGGLTKDACYLNGLRQLLAALAKGEDFETFLIGKFDIEHLSTVRELLDDGILYPPHILPWFLSIDGAKERLETARSNEVHELFQNEPAL